MPINPVVPEDVATFMDGGSVAGSPCSTLFMRNLPHAPHSLSANFSWQGWDWPAGLAQSASVALPPLCLPSWTGTGLCDFKLGLGWVYRMWPYCLPQYHKLKPVFWPVVRSTLVQALSGSGPKDSGVIGKVAAGGGGCPRGMELTSPADRVLGSV